MGFLSVTKAYTTQSFTIERIQRTFRGVFLLELSNGIPTCDRRVRHRKFSGRAFTDDFPWCILFRALKWKSQDLRYLVITTLGESDANEKDKTRWG